MSNIATKKGTFTTPSGTGNDAITGLGFTPKAILFWSVVTTTEARTTHAAHWIGMTDGTNDKVVMVAAEDDESDTRRDLNESACIEMLNANSDTTIVTATLASFDADGFTLNYSNTLSGRVVHFIAFGGDGLQAAVGQVAASAGVVTGLAFQPEFVFAMTAGLSLGGSPSQHSIHGFGCFDSSLNEWWLGSYMGQNNESPLTSVLRTGTGFIGQIYNGNLTWEATVTAINSDGWSWNGSNADGYYYLALNLDGAGNTAGTFTKSTAAAPASQNLPALGYVPQIYGLATGSNESTASSFNDGVGASIGAYDGTSQGLTFYTNPNGGDSRDQRQNDDNILGLGVDNVVFQALGTAQDIVDDAPTIIWDPNSGQADHIGFWAIEKVRRVMVVT